MSSNDLGGRARQKKEEAADREKSVWKWRADRVTEVERESDLFVSFLSMWVDFCLFCFSFSLSFPNFWVFNFLFLLVLKILYLYFY